MKFNKSFKVAISLLCVMAMLVSSLLTFTLPASAETEEYPVPTDLTNITWSDYGLTGQYTSNVYTTDKGGTYSGSIDGTLLSGYVTQSTNNQLRVGGTSDDTVASGATSWGGLVYRPNADNSGASLVVDGSVAIPGWYMEISATDVGMTNFCGAEYFLQQSIEFVDNDNDGAEDDLKLGVWINGVMAAPLNATVSGCADDGYVYVNDGAATFGSLMLTYVSGWSGSSITLRNYKAIPTTLTEYSWDAFTASDSTYPLTLGSALTYAGQGYKYGSSDAAINDTIFNGDISIPAVGNYIRWFSAASAWGWQGMQMETVLDANDNNVHKLLFYKQAGGVDLALSEQVYLHPANFGLTSFVGERFNLKMAITNRSDDGTSATLSVWVNDYWALDVTVTSTTSNPIGVAFVPVASAGSGNPAMTPYESSKPIEYPAIPFPTDYTELFASDFGIANGTYEMSGSSYDGHSGSLNSTFGMTTIDKAYLHYESITMTGQVHMDFFGSTNDLGWKLLADGDVLKLQSGYGHITANNGYDAAIKLDDTIAGVDLVGGTYDLKISVAYEGTVATLGLWFNDVLYGRKYFTFDMANKGDDDFGTCLAFRSGTTGTTGTVVINSARDLSAPTDLINITWGNLTGLTDGSYSESTSGYYAVQQTLKADGYMLRGYVTGSIGEHLNVFGPYSNWNWGGIKFKVESATTLKILGSVSLGDSWGTGEIAASSVGMTAFENTEFFLQVSSQYIDNDNDGAADDLKLGIWINGYNIAAVTKAANASYDGYFYFNDHDTGTDYLTTGFMAGQQGKGITLRSYYPEPTTTIGWTDFGIADGTTLTNGEPGYSYTGESLNNTLFNGDVTISAGMDIRYTGTKESPWAGLQIQNIDGTMCICSDTMKLLDGTKSFHVGVDPTTVGMTTFEGSKFNLKIHVYDMVGNRAAYRVWINDTLVAAIVAGPAGGYASYTLADNLLANGAGVIANIPATGPVADPNIPTDYTNIGWLHFSGLTNGTYPAVTGDLAGKGTYPYSLDHTLLSGDITFGSGTEIRYAGNNGWEGLRIRVDSSDQLNINQSTFGTSYDKYYAPSDFGLTTFIDNQINLKIALDIDDSGENYTFQIWVNNIKAGDAFTLAKGKCGVGSVLGLYDNNSGNAITLANATIATEQFPSDFTVYTPASGGVSDNAYPVDNADSLYDLNAGTISGITNFDKSALVFEKVQFEGTLDMNFFGTTADLGFKFRTNSNGTVTLTSGYGEFIPGGLTMTDAIAGVDLVGSAYKLAFTLEYVTDTQVKLGVWFNDVLYNNSYVVVDTADKNDQLGNYLFAAIGFNGAGVVTIGDPPEPETLPTDYTVLTPYDFGISDAIYVGAGDGAFKAQGKTSKVTSLDKVIYDLGEVTFTGDVQMFIAATDVIWNSLKFVTNSSSGTATLQSGYNEILDAQVSFTDDVAGVDVVGGTYDLKFTFVYIENSTDLQVGVWFNDVLYNNSYITAHTECAQDGVGTGMAIYPVTSADQVSIRSDIWPALPSDLTNINFGSFGMAENFNTAEQESPTAYGGTASELTTLTNTSFRGNITFHYENTWIESTNAEGADTSHYADYYICYGGLQGEDKGWYALRLNVRNDHIYFTFGAGEASSNLKLQASAFGKTSLMDEEIELGIDNVMYGDDMLLYIYVDGVLYNDRPVVIFDFGTGEEEMGNTIVLHAEGGPADYYKLGEFSRELSTDLYYDLANGEKTFGSTVIAVPGVYENVEWTDGAFTFVQTIVAYVVGDANGDAEIDVLDAVKVELVLAGVETGKLAVKAADFDGDYDTDDDDMTALRRYILGYEQEAEGDVMPIGGWFGPSASYTYPDVNGTTYTTEDLLTDEIFKTLAQMGINEINGGAPTQTYSTNGNSATNFHKLMTLAQNYGINMYVSDSRLSGTTSYTSAQFDSLFETYSNYENFLGLTIVDEPSSENYPLAEGYNDRPLANYSALATSINNYKPGELFGFANMFPFWKDLAKDSSNFWESLVGVADDTAQNRYMAYIRDFAEDLNMQYLSYDYYVFDDSRSVTEYFYNMAMVREVANEKGLPFRVYLQAGSNWNDGAKLMSATTNNTPTKGEFNWNANVSLAMGAKGLEYFTIVQPVWFAFTEGGTLDYDRNGLLGADGSMNVWGEYATELNAYVGKVDHVLMNATNKGVMATSGKANSVAATAIKNVMSNVSGTNPVLDSYNGVTATASDTTDGALIGCFDYNGLTALYVVNYSTTGSNTVTLNLGSTAQDYTVIGLSGTTNGNGTSAAVTLGAGEAALVVLNANF